MARKSIHKYSDELTEYARANPDENWYPLNVHPALVLAAHKLMPHIAHAATGGGCDFLMVRMPSLFDVLLVDAEDMGMSPYNGEASPLSTQSAVVLLRMDYMNDWQWNDTSVQIFSGTARQCLNFMSKLEHVTPEERRKEAEIEVAYMDNRDELMKWFGTY